MKFVTTPGATYNFTYGNFGLRTGVKVGTQSLATYSYTQDGYNRLNALDYGNGDSVEYTYNSDGSLAKQTYEDNAKVTYGYNKDGNLAVAKQRGVEPRQVFAGGLPPILRKIPRQYQRVFPSKFYLS